MKKVWKEWEVDGTCPRGRLKKTWDATVAEDCAALRLTSKDAQDMMKWKTAIGKRPTQNAGSEC